MTRLAILDPAHGIQPFYSACRRIAAVCNGEIYNWRSLRAELEKRGHRFHTRCDCEILPAAWLEWGTSLPAKINGMFALAILDQDAATLFLARDRCGQKPLYMTRSGPFRFASEIKALAAAEVPLQPDPSALATWLSLRYLPEPDTLYQHIHTLPAAHWALIGKDGSRQIQRYWTPLPRTPSDPSPDPVSTLDTLARSSVQLALQSDVPIAAYLSGGIDSALLGHYIRDLGVNLQTLSIGFGAASDETHAAAETADHLGLTHHALQLDPSSFDDLPRVVRQMERPIGDTLILAFDALAAHTAALGCKVALGGEGPDEHFAGYPFHRAFLRASRLGPVGRHVAATLLHIAPRSVLDRQSGFPASLGAEGRAKIVRYLREFSALSPFARATDLHTLFAPQDIGHLLHPDLPRSLREPVLPEPPHDLSSLLASQYSHWLPDWSLIRQDKNTMAHSLEYRAPFLDHRLIDFAFTLPDSQKIAGRVDKAIWRQLAARHLPQAIVTRPKQPFYLPLEHLPWRKSLLTLARDTLTPTALARHGWLQSAVIEPLFQATNFLPLKQLAALVILQLWLDSCQTPTD